MTGFELKHKGKITKGAVENGVISIFLSQRKGVIHLTFAGLDSDLQQHITWLDTIGVEGDDIGIKVAHVEEPSHIIKATPVDNETIEYKIDEYNRLKRYLEKEGIL